MIKARGKSLIIFTYQNLINSQGEIKSWQTVTDEGKGTLADLVSNNF